MARLLGLLATLVAFVSIPGHASERAGERVAEPRIRITPRREAKWVRRAALRARARLARPDCQRLFTDFTDEAGRSLQARLDELVLDGPQFFDLVGFYDGSTQLRCRQGRVAAFTQPGSAAVWVCPLIAQQSPDHVEFVLLHEMLHSLGLGENPPSSFSITRQVQRRCGGRGASAGTRTANR